jgi:predicted nucleotidyltransferase component of viral defense system
MITQETIKMMSVKEQTSALNIAREYCQHLFLENLYKDPRSAHLLFKGGTALRIIYHSPRFSEDLDFTGTELSFSKTEDLLSQTVLPALERTGIPLEIKESKRTSGGYLGIFTCHLYEYAFDIQVEISLRNKGTNASEPVLINSDFIPPYSLIQLQEELLIREKTSALLGRGKPRDFYDIYFLLRGHFAFPKDKALLQQILQKIEETRIDFKSELKVFLPQSHQALIKDLKNNLLRELKRYGHL